MPKITDSQIRKLRLEAGDHGDMALVEICERALNRTEPYRDAAREHCALVISEAKAQQ